jgi:hypothetical protein
VLVLTVAEFNAAVNRHYRRVILLLRILFLVLVAIWITFRYFLDPDEWLSVHIHPEFPTWLVDLWGLFAVAFVVFLLAAWPLNRLARRDQRLTCPHCDRCLLRSYWRFVATGNCLYCQREILTAPLPEKVPPLTRAQAKALAARKWRVIGIPIFEFALIAFICSCVESVCFALVEEGWVRDVVFECLTVVASISMLVWVMRGKNRWFVNCPRCGNPDVPSSVVQVERCRACGQPLIAELTVGVAPVPPRA